MGQSANVFPSDPKRNRVKTKKQNWTLKIDHVNAFQVYQAIGDSIIWSSWHILAPQQGHQGNSQKVEGNCDVPCCLCHQWKSCAYDIDMHEHQILDIRIGNKTAQKGKNIQQKMGKLYTIHIETFLFVAFVVIMAIFDLYI